MAHSACMTEGGDLFTWGKGFQGQLGHMTDALPPEVSKRLYSLMLQPKLVASLMRKKVVDISCGSKHTACVTSEGDVYTFGEGSCGQLGVGRCTSMGSPVKALPNAEMGDMSDCLFAQVACGWAHTLVLTRGGAIFSFGLNAHGQLGVGDAKTRYYPEKIHCDLLAEPASKICARGSFSAALLENTGRLLSWGCGDDGVALPDCRCHRGFNRHRCVS